MLAFFNVLVSIYCQSIMHQYANEPWKFNVYTLNNATAVAFLLKQYNVRGQVPQRISHFH